MDCRLILLNQLKKIDVESYKQTFDWLGELTLEKDHDDGKKFMKFIRRNLKLKKPLGTFVLVEEKTNKTIGIASLVKDDQDAGKEKKLTGPWIAGVIINRDFRGKGFGKTLMSLMDNQLKDSFSKNKKIRVNLFVRDPAARHIYEKIGFKSTNLKVKRANKVYTIYFKKY
jgi:RimJ/RimL family protein N-acetyltransferase